MANVYYQSSIQIVFAVKYRQALIQPNFQDRMHKYIGGILINQKHKPLAINSVEDHIHIFFGMHPCNLPALVRDIKSDTSTFINENKLSKFHFRWQEGYGFFTYSMSHRSNLISYIDNQQEHHKNKSFKKEYLGLLKKYNIEYTEKYLFDFFE